jgi:hypothetical protein
MGKAKKSTKKFLQKKGSGQQVYKKKPVAHRSRDRAGELSIQLRHTFLKGLTLSMGPNVFLEMLIFSHVHT